MEENTFWQSWDRIALAITTAWGVVITVVYFWKKFTMDKKHNALKYEFDAFREEDQRSREEDQRSREQHQRSIDHLNNKIDLLKLMSPNISTNINQRFDEADATLHFGTIKGDFSIRLHDGETVSKDIGNWIHKHGLTAPLNKIP